MMRCYGPGATRFCGSVVENWMDMVKKMRDREALGGRTDAARINFNPGRSGDVMKQ